MTWRNKTKKKEKHEKISCDLMKIFLFEEIYVLKKILLLLLLLTWLTLLYFLMYCYSAFSLIEMIKKMFHRRNLEKNAQ